MTVILLGKGVFADEMKLKILSSIWVAQADPKSDDRCPHRRLKRRRHIYPGERRRPHGDEAETEGMQPQGTPTATSIWERQGWVVSSLRRERSPADTLILDLGLPNFERIHVRCCKLPRWCNWLWQPEETETPMNFLVPAWASGRPVWSLQSGLLTPPRARILIPMC